MFNLKCVRCGSIDIDLTHAQMEYYGIVARMEFGTDEANLHVERKDGASTEVSFSGRCNDCEFDFFCSIETLGIKDLGNITAVYCAEMSVDMPDPYSLSDMVAVTKGDYGDG